MFPPPTPLSGRHPGRDPIQRRVISSDAYHGIALATWVLLRGEPNHLACLWASSPLGRTRRWTVLVLRLPGLEAAMEPSMRRSQVRS